MESQPKPALKVVFGPFEYDQASGDLRKHGSRIRLQGKPLQILLLLLNDPGRVISRDELQHHLWDGTTFVDFEQGLNSAINKLRQTLGDSADQPRYVETVPGRGSRFIAPLHYDPKRAVLEMSSPAPSRIEPKPGRESRSWMLWAAALALVVSGAYWIGRSRSPLQKLSAVRFAAMDIIRNLVQPRTTSVGWLPRRSLYPGIGRATRAG